MNDEVMNEWTLNQGHATLVLLHVGTLKSEGIEGKQGPAAGINYYSICENLFCVTVN